MKQVLFKVIGMSINIISVFSTKTAGKLAIRLFSSPRKVKLKEIEVDFLQTAYTEDIDYEDLSIRTYRWLGNKETILLAHGWESNSFRWKALIEKLKGLDYNIVALDAPAHGYSTGKLFNAILYSECINIVAKKFNANIIIGHSVGGMATAFFQQKYQLDSVEKLVLLGAPSNFVGVFSRYVNMMNYNNRVSKSMNDIILERFNEKPEYFNAARLSENITADGLIIHDELDKIIPYNDAEDFKNFYKKSRLIATKGYGHSLRAEEVNNYILDFINTNT
ncbi:alpha/beta fold hydrolase [Psychroserpens luteolus]|uniref:alpha/beta fold hydrolase n=1 Tax=Psychroserpens luteolus TaxID=2855840 RepID=UPI001E340F85|nr:alpha/beta hydrolase [Psychroserpens luteolus]MCD2260994.1 alpha/beta hydrolase [Psychroserpens luteolus]